MSLNHGAVYANESWYRFIELNHVTASSLCSLAEHYHSSYTNTCEYLEDVKWLTMSNPLHAASINGQDAVTLLDSSIPVCRTTSKHLVNLKWTQIFLKKQETAATSFMSVLYYHGSDQSRASRIQHCHIDCSTTVTPSLCLLKFINFCFNEPFNWHDEVVYYRSMETKTYKSTSEIVSNNCCTETRHF